MNTLSIKSIREYLKKILSLTSTVLVYTSVSAQSNDSLFYRHSLQLNVAGLGIERWATAYEWRITPQHALFVQAGGSFPVVSKEKEYGLGLHYKYFFQPVRDAKFLWLFKSPYKITFGDINCRYMNLIRGVHNSAHYTFESYNIGLGLGQTWVWNKGFTVSYWLGYGPPIKSTYKWKDSVPQDGDSWAKMYKWAAGLDFGVSIGYSFGRHN